MKPTRLDLAALAQTGFFYCPNCQAAADTDTDAIAKRTCTRCGRSPLNWFPGYKAMKPPSPAPPEELIPPVVPADSFMARIGWRGYTSAPPAAPVRVAPLGTTHGR